MKLYLECNMGASGDMLMAALLELLPDPESFLQKMNGLGIPGVQIECERSVKCGISGSHIRVRVLGKEETAEDVSLLDAGNENSGGRCVHAHEISEHHYNYADMCALIGKLPLPEEVRADALAVYRIISEAESEVHAVPVEQIHFHELGSMDAVADVVGCCLLFHMLHTDSVFASAVHVGSGFVRCAHGILPVPAPATSVILKGVPIYAGKIKGELCTPTGAALLRHFVKRFGDMEPMKVVKIGYGMGTKDFEAINCVRAFWGDGGNPQGEIIEISCNLDDMTPEAIGYAIEQLLANGALDVFAAPITMKKNRPATMLTCLCKPNEKENLSRLMLFHTTTLGVRFHTCRRDVLDYSFSVVETPYGKIRVKSASGYDISRDKPEYEDVRCAAQKYGVPFTEVYRQAVAAIANANRK